MIWVLQEGLKDGSFRRHPKPYNVPIELTGTEENVLGLHYEKFKPKNPPKVKADQPSLLEHLSSLIPWLYVVVYVVA